MNVSTTLPSASNFKSFYAIIINACRYVVTQMSHALSLLYFNTVVLEESSVVQELSWNDLTIRNNKGVPSPDNQGEHKIKMHLSGSFGCG